MLSKRAENVFDAGLGSILGALIGDASGVVLEFHGGPPSREAVERALALPGGGYWKVAPGQVSDDGELAICQLYGLSSEPGFCIESIAQRYNDWINSKPFDVGNTTRLSIGGMNLSGWKELSEEMGFAVAMKRAAAMYCRESKANGSLMRSTPLGVFGHRFSNESIASFARADSCLSHPNETCCASVAAYCLGISRLVEGEPPAKVFEEVCKWAETGSNQEVRDWLADAQANRRPQFYPQAGFVKIAFTEAFRHLLLESDFKDALRETLLGGGDTDTNACIVGGMLGALIGARNLPMEMKEAVLSCDTTKVGRRPRPDFLHPKHVLHLVERLLSGNK